MESAMEPHMTSFGIPIVCRIEGGGTIEDVQKALSEKISKNFKLEDYPSLLKKLLAKPESAI